MNKNNEPAELWTHEKLEMLISEKMAESLKREYKRGAALNKDEKTKSEISKDVSSFANSAGGQIIYGMAEDQEKHLPVKLDPISKLNFTKEWLEDIITSNIQPKIDGLVIHSVELNSPDHVCYVVDIPQSTTAHQAKDRCYYRRRNFKCEPMLDYEVRDVMNRTKYPIIEVKSRLTGNPWNQSLELKLTNMGLVMARQYAVHVYNKVVSIKNENKNAPEDSYKLSDEYVNARPPFPPLKTPPPIFPGSSMVLSANLDGFRAGIVVCRVFADEMPFLNIEINLDGLTEKWE